MGKNKVPETLSRRDLLKLAGTAAAFCASFGFLHGSQTGGVVQDKHAPTGKYELSKWTQAEIKWYSGATLLESVPIPVKVLKHLQSDPAATVEIKLFRSGQLLRNLGTIQGKH